MILSAVSVSVCVVTGACAIHPPSDIIPDTATTLALGVRPSVSAWPWSRSGALELPRNLGIANFYMRDARQKIGPSENFHVLAMVDLAFHSFDETSSFK